jgi:hypothetical protein
MIAEVRHPERAYATAAAVLLAIVLLAPIRLHAGEPTDVSVGTLGLRCETQQRRALRDERSDARRLLRAARGIGECRVVADRLEICEPAYLRTTSAGADGATEGRDAMSPRQLCVLVECDRTGAAGEVIDLNDALGQRSVTAVVLDRVCLNLD